MIRRGWSKEAVGKYTALQVPSAAFAGLVLWFLWDYGLLPAWLAWGVFLLWMAKDAALFFYLWPAYEPGGDMGPFSPVGLVGRATGDLDNAGRVRLRGETWRAKTEPGQGPVRCGQSVRIVERRGLLLIVRPEETGDS